MGGTCSSCGAMISTGSPICASCGAPQRPAGSGSSTQSQPSPGGFCGSCGARLISKHSPCPDCGHVKTTFNPQPNPGNPNPYGGNPNPNRGYPPQQQGGLYKNPTTALILAIVLGFLGIEGVGQIYVGKVGRGIGILIACFALWIIGIATFAFFIGIAFIVAGFIVFIWSIFDTNKLVKEYNNFVSKNGRAPW